MKICTRCHTEKPLTDFYKAKRYALGVRSECKRCSNIGMGKYKKRHNAKINEYQKQYREDNKEKIASQTTRWNEANKKEQSLKKKQWYQENREEVLIRVSQYQKENRSKYNAIFKKYKAAKLQAIPAWFEKDKIEKVYDKAQEFNMHVDHIVPLQSDKVCGLHCWHNLQLLDSSLNCAKGNYYWPER